MRLLTHRALFVAVVAALAACGGDSPTQNTPSIALTVSGQALTLAQGSSGTLTASVARTSFDGAVNLTAEGAPAGMTVTFTPASLTGAVNASTITFAAGASTPSGTHTVTIRAAGSGVTAQTKTVAVTVNTSGGFSLSMAPSSVTMSQGGSAAATVNIARTGTFTDAVALTVSGAPAGMTVAVTPTSVTGASAALAISAGGATPIGNHTLTVRGNATGMAEQTVTFTASVTAPPAGTQITIRTCDSELPAWVGFQNDGGNWTAVAGTAGTYTFTMNATKGGVAFAYGNATDGYETEVIYATAAEFASLATASNAFCPSTSTALKTHTGTVAGVGATQYAEINLSDGYDAVYGNATTSYTLTDVLDGPRDLVAFRGDMNTFIPDRVIVRRGLNLANNATIPVLDFAAAEAVAVAQGSVTLNGKPAGYDVFTYSTFRTANGTWGGSSYEEITGTTGTYHGVPTSKLIAGDMHELYAYASSTTSNDDRTVAMYNQAVGARSLTFGPAVSAPTISTLSATTPVRLRAQIPVQAEYNGAASAYFAQNTRDVYITVTAAYRGAATTWDIVIPDFGTASGYGATWGLQAGQTYEWGVFVSSGSLTSELAPTEGLTVRTAQTYSSAPASPFAASVQGRAAAREQRRLLNNPFRSDR